MSEELPSNIVQITTLSINRNKRKNCDCMNGYPRKQPQYIVDAVNREVICKHCGVIVDAFEAMENISKFYERLQDEVKHLLEQRKQIANYKPWLVAVRRIEQQTRQGMVPRCPHCERSFKLEEITCWTSKR